jgi:flagellar motor switch protein FliG
MRELGVLPRERVRGILHDYAAEATEQTGFAADTGRFLDEALKQAFRPERAQAMLQRLDASGGEAKEKLAWREPAEIAGLLEAQPPQLIAVVLVQLPRDVAAAVLDVLPGKTRADTLLSLAHSDAPSADMLADLNDWLTSLDAAAPPQGEAAVASLLGQMSEGSAAAALTQLDQNDADLAARLRVRNLGFEDLARLPAASRKTFLRNVGARTLLHALKGSDGRVLDALTAVMSPTAAQRMRDDLDTLGAVPVTAIQTAQDEAGATLRRLAAEGAILYPEEEEAAT